MEEFHKKWLGNAIEQPTAAAVAAAQQTSTNQSQTPAQQA